MRLFSFAHRELLWLLLLMLPVYLFFQMGLRYRQDVAKKLGEPKLIQSLLVHFHPGQYRFHFWLRFIALCLLLLAVAGPRISGAHQVNIGQKGRDVIIALDVSNSMLATDVAPSRLEKARQLIFRLISQMQGENFGLIFFAGRAYQSLPLTSDAATALMVLQSASSESVPVQGTAIGAAIAMAAASADDAAQRTGILILVTDGEDHEADAIAQARMLKEKGIALLVMGVGTPQGAVIPDAQTQLPRKDKEGNLIITRFNEAYLREIADAGGGSFMHLDAATEQLPVVKAAIDQLDKRVREQPAPWDYRTLYAWLLLPALLLLMVDVYFTSNA